MVFEKAKGIAKNAFARKVSQYLADASPKTLSRLWWLFEKAASTEADKREARRFQWLIESGHPFGEWLQRVSNELNEKARVCLINNLYGNGWFLNKGTRQQFEEKHGYNPPHFFVVDVTARCNLNCEGCWAGNYSRSSDLDLDLLDRTLTEAKEEMGVHFFVFSGGEPTLRDDLFELYRKHDDCQFQIYTNGTLIDEEMADTFAELGNVMPMLSIEGSEVLTNDRRGSGVHNKVMAAMNHMRERGVLFGFSATATRKNAEAISSEEFIERMIDKGCLYGWYFQYIPIGRNPNMDLMVTAEQRDMLRKRMYDLRSKYPIFMCDFWNDGPEVNGCMAGGHRYFHITNDGDLEPCVFCHFAAENIQDKSLTEALKHPFYRDIRECIPYDGNSLRPCMLIDRPWVFREHFENYDDVEPTHPGAESLVEDLADDLDEHARQWAEVADRAWREGDFMGLFPYPPGDEPEYLAPEKEEAAARET